MVAKRQYRRRLPLYRNLRLRKGPFPKTMTTTMRYCSQISINPGLAGVPGYHYFRANSIFDPDFTGVGHQPLGHDVFEGIYHHYAVKRCTLTAKYLTTAASETEANMVCGVRIDKDTTTSPAGSGLNLIEQDNCAWAVIGPESGKALTVSKTFDSVSFLGLQNAQLGSSLVGADFGANPGESAYFQVFCFPLRPTSDGATSDILVTMTYTVILSSPLDLAQS